MCRQRGFTLVELVLVIIILGILSVSALPKFLDLSNDASTAAVRAVAGNLTSWGLSNKMAVKLGRPLGANGVFAIDSLVDACANGGNSVWAASATGAALGYPVLAGTTITSSATLPDTNTYQIIASTPSICGTDIVIRCTLKHKNGQTATAYIPCTN